MAKLTQKCCVCGKEYVTYDDPLAYRPWCSVGCQFKLDSSVESETIDE